MRDLSSCGPINRIYSSTDNLYRYEIGCAKKNGILMFRNESSFKILQDSFTLSILLKKQKLKYCKTGTSGQTFNLKLPFINPQQNIKKDCICSFRCIVW